MGEQPDSPPEVLDALERKGLIARERVLFEGPGWIGSLVRPRYEVPIRHHAAWCEWVRAQAGGKRRDG